MEQPLIRLIDNLDKCKTKNLNSFALLAMFLVLRIEREIAGTLFTMTTSTFCLTDIAVVYQEDNDKET